MSEPSSSGRPRGDGANRTLTIHIGHEEVLIRQRYEVVSITNDILIAVWFLVGSVMFFYTDWEQTGTWCFVFGSVELLIRPLIRLSRHVHLLRMHGGNYAIQEASQDF
ncbi:YrhK-like protein [Streptomyces sp. Amel2xB2]|uniref:YrhK family protein n=1 Tax=Streptomyces sp. Amel2xB2 TaxID=1305829 RepID=UPI000DB95470|nr:YrhK family protein [Streptomyces sp. Amel2xB2]RAJ69173.1 YrhK-like protein [Streptomyces sp. Amel2xB2]